MSLTHKTALFLRSPIAPCSKQAPNPRQFTATVLVDALDHPNKTMREAATEGIVSIFLFDQNMNVHKSLFSLLQFMAQHSAFEDVRRGCIHGIYLSRDLDGLRSLALGSYTTVRFRNAAVKNLEKELQLSS